jgi:hypothetical protein
MWLLRAIVEEHKWESEGLEAHICFVLDVTAALLEALCQSFCYPANASHRIVDASIMPITEHLKNTDQRECELSPCPLSFCNG